MNNHAVRAAPVQAGLALIVLLFAACASTPPAPAPGGAPAVAPAPALPVAGATVYRVLPQESELRIRVWRGGPLAGVGHNHVIVSSAAEGNIYLQPDFDKSGFELRVPLQSLKVDPPAARQEEGTDFSSKVTDDDRAGTRKNMLGPDGLDAAKYPVMTLRSIRIEGPAWYPRITVRITLHGVSRDYVVPTAIVRGNGRLTAIGGLHLKQSDFGIVPFSVLGGALQVRDALDVSFRFVAAPAHQ